MINFQPFINYLTSEKRMSKHTILAYQGDLNQFNQYMEDCLEIKELSTITTSDIRSWIISLLEDECLSSRTVTRKLSALKAFYRHETKVGHVSKNPMLQIQSPKFQKKLPEYVEQGDMSKLFQEGIFEDSFEGQRNQLIIELLYATGIRLSELLNIRKQDINLYDRNIKVLGKRNKERIIPFGDNLKCLLTKYMEKYDQEMSSVCGNYYIFVAANGKQLYPKAIYRIVQKYLSMVTTIRKKSPHVIRHTFATHMLNNGADLNAIKEILGHSSLAATQVYTHNSMEQLKNIYKQAHPRA